MVTPSTSMRWYSKPGSLTDEAAGFFSGPIVGMWLLPVRAQPAFRTRARLRPLWSARQVILVLSCCRADRAARDGSRDPAGDDVSGCGGGGELCVGHKVCTHVGRSSSVRCVHVPSGAGTSNVFSS